MANELLPCPFCGDKPTATLNVPYKDLISISCENLKCTAKPYIVVKNFVEAIERWNTRAIPPTPPNPPLTLQQLKERVGNPVWCKWLLEENIKISKGKWFIVVKEKEKLVCKCPLDYGSHICSNSNYRKTWIAYDHEVKENNDG